ncbi:MAG: PAS domain S-box protein [Verrucomicrobiota bacterium]
MNLTSQAIVPNIGLPPEQFAAAFPFHIAINRNLVVVQTGRTLQRICPDAAPGIAVDRVFRLAQPEGQWSFEWLVENHRQLFLLVHLASGLQLRGEFIALPGERRLLFLGSPWFTDSAEISERGLDFEDFAIHDPAVDLLQVFQAQKMALADAKKLLAKLSAQRAELRTANERLQQQENESRKLALIAARTDNSIVLTNAEGRTMWVNEGFTRLTGYTLEEMLGKKPGAVLQGPGTDPATVRHMSEQLRQGKGFRAEILNYSKHGRCYWLATEVQPIHDDQGRLTNFMAIQSDVTLRRSAQQRLAIQFEVSRALAETANLTAAIPQVLQSICENLGWQVGEFWRLSGERLLMVEIWHPPEVRVPNFIHASRTTEFTRGIGLPGRIWATAQPAWIPNVSSDANFPRGVAAADDGLRGAFGFPVFVQETLWGVAEFFGRKIEEPDEALLKTFSTVGHQIGQFIERQEAEESLRETNTLQRAILEGANYAIISTSPDGIIQLFNPAAQRMLGYTAAEMIGRQTPVAFHDADEVGARANELTAELGREVKPGFETFVAKAERGEPDEREWTYIRKDGSRFPVLLSVTALFDERGRITGHLGVAFDLTLRKRDEEKLRTMLSELERFNRVMMNREERVLELKREINQLLATVGQPPAYSSVVGTKDNHPRQSR